MKHSQIIYKLETEWDLGLSEVTFTTKALALKTLRKAHDDLMEDEYDFDECIKDGLYTVTEVILYSK